MFVDDAERMYLPEFQKDKLIRLCIAQVDRDRIAQGVENIAKYIDSLKHQQVSFIEGINQRL